MRVLFGLNFVPANRPYPFMLLERRQGTGKQKTPKLTVLVLQI